MGIDLVQRRQNALVDGEVILNAVAVLIGLGGQRAIPGVDRKGAPRDFNDRRTIEMLGEALQVDGRRGDDDLQVGPARQQRLEVAKQEVDIEAAFMGLVDDDGVVTLEETVVLGFSQQDAISHQLDQRAVLALVLEANLITHQLTQRRADLFGNTSGNATSSQPARLRVADQAMHAPADFQTDLRQLGGLA